MKKIVIATVVIAGLAFSAKPASAQYCVAGILFAAFYANATENRELSAKEASTCGLFYGTDRDKAMRNGKPIGAEPVSAKPVAIKPVAAKAPKRTKTAARAKPQ